MSEASLPGEDRLIAGLTALLPPTRHTLLAIGDDAAAFTPPAGELVLVTTDVLMEGVHFRLSWGDLPALGWKALAQNLSDIAAMGGTPTHAVISLALPSSWTPDDAGALYHGLAELAAQSGTDIVGGDTIRSSGPLTLNLTVLGRVPPAELLTRSGGHAGDAIYVTGTLGAAAAGLRVLDAGRSIPDALRPAIQAQLRPQPRLAAARALATSGRVTAMMDLSDGVATDLHRLCRASGVGAQLDGAAVPIAPVTTHACAWLADAACAPLRLALCGGEDFELLFTAPAETESLLRERIAPLPLTRIGTLTAALDVLLRTGDRLDLLPWGFTHF